jgi:hypothetical protein
LLTLSVCCHRSQEAADIDFDIEGQFGTRRGAEKGRMMGTAMAREVAMEGMINAYFLAELSLFLICFIESIHFLMPATLTQICGSRAGAGEGRAGVKAATRKHLTRCSPSHDKNFQSYSWPALFLTCNMRKCFIYTLICQQVEK